jgi:hypothetical protein
VLQPIPIRVESQHLVGKETHRLRERRVGWRTTDEERTTFNRQDDLATRILPTLSDMTERQLREHGIEPRTLRKIRATHGQTISPQLALRLEHAAAAFARAQLRTMAQPAPNNPLAACTAYLNRRDQARKCAWPGCDTPLTGRQRHWCSQHADRSGQERARHPGYHLHRQSDGEAARPPTP